MRINTGKNLIQIQLGNPEEGALTYVLPIAAYIMNSGRKKLTSHTDPSRRKKDFLLP